MLTWANLCIPCSKKEGVKTIHPSAPPGPTPLVPSASLEAENDMGMLLGLNVEEETPFFLESLSTRPLLFCPQMLLGACPRRGAGQCRMRRNASWAWTSTNCLETNWVGWCTSSRRANLRWRAPTQMRSRLTLRPWSPRRLGSWKNTCPAASRRRSHQVWKSQLAFVEPNDVNRSSEVVNVCLLQRNLLKRQTRQRWRRAPHLQTAVTPLTVKILTMVRWTCTCCFILCLLNGF